MNNTTPKKHPIRERVAFYVRELVAIATWGMIFVKVFVFDVDLLLVQKVVWLERLYPFKFFLLITLIAIAWLVLGTKRAAKVIGYVLVYPFIVVLWRIPKLIFKNWALFVVFAPAIESVVLTVKWRFVLACFTVLAALGIGLSRTPAILITCMTMMGLYLIYHYALRLQVAFRPTSIFADVAPIVEKMWRSSIDVYKKDEDKARSGPGAKREDYPRKHIENVKNLYVNNLFYAHISKKLDVAVSSRRTDMYFIGALIYSFVLTVTIFAFEYFALFKLDQSAFQNAAKASYWSFWLFSFNAILHTSFATVSPTSDSALLIANLELVSGLVIGLCLVFVLLTSSRERYRHDVKTVADNLNQSARRIEQFLEKRLYMRLIDAEVKIIAQDPTFADMLRTFGRTPPLLEPPAGDNATPEPPRSGEGEGSQT